VRARPALRVTPELPEPPPPPQPAAHRSLADGGARRGSISNSAFGGWVLGPLSMAGEWLRALVALPQVWLTAAGVWWKEVAFGFGACKACGRNIKLIW